MRAVRFYEYGGPEVLRVEEVPVPEPAAGEVLLRVYATAVRRTDVSMHYGKDSYFKAPLPFQLGRESSGVVAATGRGVDRWQEGDEAIAQNITPCGQCDNCRRDLLETCRRPRYQGVSAWGGYADYITVPAGSLIPKPATVGHDQAASFQGGLQTAWHNLVTRGRLHAGETILIPSASGAVASAGLQIARFSGARTLATTSSEEKARRARALGADAVINYTREDLSKRVKELTEGRGVDVIFDTVGGDGFQHLPPNLVSGGRILIPGLAAGSELKIKISPLIQNQASLLFSKGSRPDEAKTIVALLAEQRLKVAISHVFPLERAAEAHRVLERREQFGRVLLDVAGHGYQPNV
ncbi:MAG TPA: zinc-binding dehydrogenase [Candidatus Binatia bacterium]